jgi:hypothetical protein
VAFDHIRDNRFGGSDSLLGSCFQGAGTFSPGAHGLDAIHQFFRLIDERIAKVAGPGNVIIHLLDDLGNSGDRLDVRIPGLGIEVCDIVGVSYEAGGLDNFQWISRRGQEDGDDRVGIKRNGGYEFFEVRGAALGRGRRWWSSV